MRQIILLFLLSFACFFVHLDLYEPDIMEARNFSTAREIVESGNWLVPTMNGQPRLAKPPLPTWMTAVSGIVGGVENEYVLRLPAAFCGALLVIFMFLFVRNLTRDPQLPFISAAVLGTTVMVIMGSRAGNWDMANNAFMLGAIWLLYQAVEQDRTSWWRFGLAGILMGLSILSKAYTAFYCILFPFTIAYIATKGWKGLLRHWTGLAITGVLTLGLGLAWYVYVKMQYPDLWDAVFQQESADRVGKHVRPFYFYMHFPVYMGLWVFFLLAAFIYPYARKRIENFGNYRFFLIWAVLALVLLSLVPQKKERYLIPLFIPLALLASYYIRYLIEAFRKREFSSGDQWVFRIYAWTTILATVAIPSFCIYYYLQISPSNLFYLVAAGILFPLLGGFLLYQVRNQNIATAFYSGLAITALACLLLFPLGPNMIYKNQNYRDLREVRQLDELKDLPLYSLRDELNMKRIWDIGKPVSVWKYNVEPPPKEDFPLLLFSIASPEIFDQPFQEKYTYEILEVFDYEPIKSDYLMYVSKIDLRKKSVDD